MQNVLIVIEHDDGGEPTAYEYGRTADTVRLLDMLTEAEGIARGMVTGRQAEWANVYAGPGETVDDVDMETAVWSWESSC